MKQITLISTLLFVGACGGSGNGDLLNGEACMESSSCTSGLCVTEYENGTEVSEGVCTDECMWEDDGSDTCMEGEVCLRYTPTDEYYCYQTCESDAECRMEDEWSCTCLDFLCTSKACIPPL